MVTLDDTGMDSVQTHNSPINYNLPIRELVSPKKGWECEICGFQSAFKTSLINHQAVHSDARPFECPICEYAAKRKYDLKKHMQLKHGRDESVLGLSKVDYTSHLDGIYGAVVSSSVRANTDSPLSPQHGSEHSRIDTSEVRNTDFDRPPPKITVPRYVASSEKKIHLNLFDVKSEPCDVDEDDEDANLGVSFKDPHDHEVLSTGREMYSINASDKLSKVRSAAYMDTKLCNVSPSKPHSSFQVQTNEHLHLRPSVNPFYTDSNSDSSTHINHVRTASQRENVPLKRSLYSGDSDTEGSHHKLKRVRQFSSQTDDPSSSISRQSETPTHSEVSCSSVKTDKQCETKRTFSCPHCNILYFDHALYLMHMGLHSSDNPWTCAICGGDFWEKYSFTSHFINLHSQATSGE